MLTPEQQALAEEAMELLPVCLNDFRNRYPFLRAIAAVADLESAALLAITKAARTYDPNRAGVSAYFSKTIRNACLREIENEIKSRSHSHYRISFEMLEARMDVENEPLADPIMSELVNLSEEDMRDIEARAFENKSIRAFSREWGISTRQAKKKLMVKLDRLAEAWRQSAHR
jgi:RNA polymerase sigma factor (sigma-70 family)